MVKTMPHQDAREEGGIVTYIWDYLRFQSGPVLFLNRENKRPRTLKGEQHPGPNHFGHTTTEERNSVKKPKCSVVIEARSGPSKVRAVRVL
jgi:hypothetical protein